MTPKQQFNLDKLRVSHHNEMVGSELFRASSQTTLLQMQENLLGTNATGEKALANYYKFEGARLFLQTFNNLGRMEEPVEKTGLPDNLRHEITSK